VLLREERCYREGSAAGRSPSTTSRTSSAPSASRPSPPRTCATTSSPSASTPTDGLGGVVARIRDGTLDAAELDAAELDAAELNYETPRQAACAASTTTQASTETGERNARRRGAQELHLEAVLRSSGPRAIETLRGWECAQFTLDA
jgi:hypothetical protein